MRAAIAALLLVVVASPAWAQEGTAPVGTSAYLAARAKHVTRITNPRKPPAFFESMKAPGGVEEIAYPSGDLTLKAWFARPKNKPKTERVPVVVYFHAGFAFKWEDWTSTAPFRDAGFAVLCPMLRAENGNPGTYELFLGEIDDARAAIRWAAAQPGIDAERVFTFGHSIGGAVSALISLYDEPKVALTGGAGGLFPRQAFDELWDSWLPFDGKNAAECDMRILASNFAHMRRRHVAYIGREDEVLGQRLKPLIEQAKKVNAPLEVEKVNGAHMGCLRPAIKNFIERIRQEPAKR